MTAPTLRIERFSPGPYQTNCYLLSAEGAQGCWIIDAGFEPGAMLRRAAELGGVKAIILTHTHIDHIAGVHAAKQAFPDAPLCVHAAEAGWLQDPRLNLSAFSGKPTTTPPADRTLAESDTISVHGHEFSVLHTPGHSPGSISVYCPGSSLVISGDALFAGSIGRTDFPGCSFEQLAESIRTKLYALPDDTRVLPGHGPATTIGNEKRSNPFVRA